MAAGIRPPVFAELESKVEERKRAGLPLAPLHLGDTHRAPPAAARRLLASLDWDDPTLHRYGATAGEPALREALAAYLARHRAMAVDPAAELVIGAGGTHVLSCVARAALDPGDEVLLVAPYWPLAPGVFRTAGAVPVEVDLAHDVGRAEQGAPVDVEARLLAACTERTRAVYLVTPNNPDGVAWRAQDLEAVVRVAEARDLWIVSDEVYGELAWARPHVSVREVAGGRARARTIVLGSLSKSHAFPGARIGFAVLPPALVPPTRRVSVHSLFNAPVALQRAAAAALGDDAFVAETREAYAARAGRVTAALDAAGMAYVKPHGATYVFVDLREGLAGRPLLGLLDRALDEGVLLAPGSAFGASYAGWARLCFTAVDEPAVLAGVAALARAARAF